MKGFFKYVFASMIGFILGYLVIFIIMMLLVFGSISLIIHKSFKSLHTEVKVKENSVLKLELKKPIREMTDDNPFAEMDFFSEEMSFPITLKSIIDNIKRAKDDDNIKGIVLKFTIIQASFATLEEIRNALLDFKKSGKFIYAYGDLYTEGSYYLASLADSIFIQPEGAFIFDGFHSELLFLKRTFDKLEIEPTLIRVGKYKSAGESFIREDMSEENRLQMTELVESVYNHYLKQISKSRKIKESILRNIADNFLIRKAEDAVKYKLVSNTCYKDQFLEKVKKAISEDKPNFISLSKYTRVGKSIMKGKKKHSKDKIALIYAVGGIGLGKGSSQSIGSETLSKAIYKARTDDKVKAIVLRVNSPGGGALASDIIWREVKLASEAKPLVVSMGDVAASGGYYIACAADTILAEPNTVTGSIGVFGLHLNMKDFWNNKLGFTFDRTTTGKYSDIGNPNRAMSEDERAIIQFMVDDVYENFITHVAQGRNMTKEMVDSFGGGRVWTGEQALEIGLVDKLGGMYDAIEIAAKMANIEDYELAILPDSKSPFEKFLHQFGASNLREMIIKQALGEDYKIYAKAKEARKLNGVYMLMPFDIDIR